VEARRAHNPKVVGSSPTPATNEIEAGQIGSAFSFAPEESYNNGMANSQVDDSNLQSILTALQKLSPADRQAVIQALQSGPVSILEKPADGVGDWQNDLRLRGLAEGTITLYSRTVTKLLEQNPIPTNRTVRAYLAERLKVVTPTKVRKSKACGWTTRSRA
jgi:hypothetical protein